MKILIVGAGLSGSVIARQLAEHGHDITIIDKRDHIGGNCYDYENGTNRVHKYGPHLMHHNDDEVHEFLMRFSEWIPYEHLVKVDVKGELISFPINKNTLNQLYGITSDEDVKSYFNKNRNLDLVPTNCDELFEHSVGNELADIFFRPYTEKMWGVKPTEIDCAIGARIPVRENSDERYFSDKYQYMPKNGYTKMFENMLNHENITTMLGTTFNKKDECNYDHIFNSMPIDVYYDFMFGKLPYRSLEFVNQPDYLDTKATTINSSSKHGFTRFTKWKNIPGHGDGPLATFEYPVPHTDKNEPYYPVSSGKDLYQKYSEYAIIHNHNTTFIGRLATYQYIDMWKAIKLSLGESKKFINRLIKKDK